MALEENRKRSGAWLTADKAKMDAEAKKARGEQLFGVMASRSPARSNWTEVSSCLRVLPMPLFPTTQHAKLWIRSGLDMPNQVHRSGDREEIPSRQKRNAKNLPDLRLYVPGSLQGWTVASHQVILTLRQQGKLMDESGAFVPSAQERKRQALSDVIETSVGVAIPNQLQQFGSTTNFLAALGPSSNTAHQPSNVTALPPGFAGVQLDFKSSAGRDVYARLKSLSRSFQARHFNGRRYHATS
jgi:hypothetical protein